MIEGIGGGQIVEEYTSSTTVHALESILANQELDQKAIYRNWNKFLWIFSENQFGILNGGDSSIDDSFYEWGATWGRSAVDCD